MITWILLALSVVAWSILGLAGVFGTPHPTLSTLVTEATSGPIGRAVLLAAWLAAGYVILRWPWA